MNSVDSLKGRLCKSARVRVVEPNTVLSTKKIRPVADFFPILGSFT